MQWTECELGVGDVQGECRNAGARERGDGAVVGELSRIAERREWWVRQRCRSLCSRGCQTDRWEGCRLSGNTTGSDQFLSAEPSCQEL